MDASRKRSSTSSSRRRTRAIVRSAALVVGDQEVARELAQDAFVKALLHWRRVRTYEHPQAWVRKVVFRMALRARTDGGAARARASAGDRRSRRRRSHACDRSAAADATSPRSHCTTSMTSRSRRWRTRSDAHPRRRASTFTVDAPVWRSCCTRSTTMPLTDEQLRSSLAAMPLTSMSTWTLAIGSRADRPPTRSSVARCRSCASCSRSVSLAPASRSSRAPARASAAERRRGARTDAVRSATPLTTLVPPGVEQIPASAVTDYTLPSGAGHAFALGDGAVWVGGGPPSGPCHSGCGCGHADRSRLGIGRGDDHGRQVPAFVRRSAWAALDRRPKSPTTRPAIVVAIDPATNQVVAQTDLSRDFHRRRHGPPADRHRCRRGVGAVRDRAEQDRPGVRAVVAEASRSTTRAMAASWRNDRGRVGGRERQRCRRRSIRPRWRRVQSRAWPQGFIQSATIDGESIWLTEATTRYRRSRPGRSS